MSSDTPRTRALITRGYSLIDEHTVLLQLCTKLEIENAELRAKVSELERENSALRAKVDELEQDKARLDWLNKWAAYIATHKVVNDKVVYEHIEGDDMRQAIDAARKNSD